VPVYEYDLGVKGLFKLIFKKKICPQCGQKLKKMREKEYLGKESASYDMGPTDAYRISIWYHCETCGVDFNLKDL